MRPQEVPDDVAQKAADEILAASFGQELPEAPEHLARHALAAVLKVEEVWACGPGALPLPPQIITHEGVFHEDGVTPLEITDEAMRAGGWKRQRRLVTEWVEA
jgi:hypothetical protein